MWKGDRVTWGDVGGEVGEAQGHGGPLPAFGSLVLDTVGVGRQVSLFVLAIAMR